MKKLLLCVLAAGMLFMSCTPSSGSNNQPDKTSNENESVTQEPTTPTNSEPEAEPEIEPVVEPEEPVSLVKVYDTFPVPGHYGSVMAGPYSVLQFKVSANEFTLINKSNEATYLINQVIEVPLPSTDYDYWGVPGEDFTAYKYYFLSLIYEDIQYYAAVAIPEDKDSAFTFYFRRINDDFEVAPVCHSYIQPDAFAGCSPRWLELDLDASINALVYKKH